MDERRRTFVSAPSANTNAETVMNEFFFFCFFFFCPITCRVSRKLSDTSPETSLLLAEHNLDSRKMKSHFLLFGIAALAIHAISAEVRLFNPQHHNWLGRCRHKDHQRRVLPRSYVRRKFLFSFSFTSNFQNDKFIQASPLTIKSVCRCFGLQKTLEELEAELEAEYQARKAALILQAQINAVRYIFSSLKK